MSGLPSNDPGQPLYSQALHADDWNAFSLFIEPLRSRLESCIGLLIGDLDEAASIVQDAMARCGQERYKLIDGAPVYPWLRAIAINLSKQFLDRRSRQARVRDMQSDPTMQSIFEDQRSVLSEILKDELATKVWLAVEQLPDAYREAVVLHYIDGMDYAQMSQLTGVGEGALRARAMRGRNLLRGTLGSIVDTWMRS
jgi:RNA polymerase sigma factor (sigma-70 family)